MSVKFKTNIEGTAFNDITGLASIVSPVNGTAAVGTSTTVARQDHVHGTDTTRAPLVSPNFTGNATFAGNATFTGLAYQPYHAVSTSQYFFDSYNGDRNLRWYVQGAYSDIIRNQPYSTTEYWDGSAWVAWTAPSLFNVMLDGQRSTGTGGNKTGTNGITNTTKKFRFEVIASTAYPTQAIFWVETSWVGFSYPGLTAQIEEFNTTTSTWTTPITTTFTTANSVTDWGLAGFVTWGLHSGYTKTRITLEFGTIPTTGNYTSVDIRNIMITSNYAGTSNFLPFSTDYNKNVTFGGSLTVPGNITMTNALGLDGGKAVVIGGWATNTPNTSTPSAQLVLSGAHNAGFNNTTKLLIEGYDNEISREVVKMVDENGTVDLTINSHVTTPSLVFRGEMFASSNQRVFADNYHPNADTLTTERTITLGGDLSGSASFNGGSDITITAVVADDSHNHIISNVDGLQTALDGKAPTVSPTFTGTANASNLTVSGTLTGTLSGNATTSSSTSGNAATATKIATITNTNIVQLDADQTLTNKILTEPTINDAFNTGRLYLDDEDTYFRRDGTGEVSISGDIIVTRESTDTLINKTLFRSLIQDYAVFKGGTSGTTKLAATAVAGTTLLTLPAATDTLVGRATNDTLSNKTLTAPNIGSGAIFNGSTSGAIKLQATAVAGNNILTLPAETGTLATVGGTETLEGKTLTSPVINSPTGLVKGDVGLGNVDNTSNATERAAAATLANKTLTTPIISSISNTGTLTLPTSTDTLVGRDTTDTLTNKTLRRTVESKTTDYDLVASDAGKVILMDDGGVDITIPANVFTAGDEFTIINNSGSATPCLVKTAAQVTMFVVGTAYLNANFTLAARRGIKFICEVGGASPRFYGWRS
jgi:hypothetical protein